MIDMVKISIVGEVLEVPQVGPTMYKLEISNIRQNATNVYTVYGKKKEQEAIDLHRGDRILILDGALETVQGKPAITVPDGAKVFVIRDNNNDGVIHGEELKEVQNA